MARQVFGLRDVLSARSAAVNGQVVNPEGRHLWLMTHPAALLPYLERDEWALEAVAASSRATSPSVSCRSGLPGCAASRRRSSRGSRTGRHCRREAVDRSNTD
jgi:hypothetical protein